LENSRFCYPDSTDSTDPTDPTDSTDPTDPETKEISPLKVKNIIAQTSL